MTAPWFEDETKSYDHNTYTEDGIIKCKDCNKMATDKSRLKRTPCHS